MGVSNWVSHCGVRNYRVNNHDKFGVYLGATLGYDFYQSSTTEQEDSVISIVHKEVTDNGLTGIAIGGQVRLRYFFTEKFAGFFQFDLGNYLDGRISITYKL